MIPLYLLFAISVCTTVGAHLCFKKGVLQLGQLTFSLSAIWGIFQNAWILFGGFLFIISFLTWLFILTKLQLNVAYPIIIGIEASLVTITSWLLFKEYLSLFQILGIVFVMVGIFLLLSKI